MDIALRLSAIKNAIAQAAKESQRAPDAVRLLAVSKGQSITKIREAFGCGQQEFAENYWQEAEKKMALLHDLPIIWHFIGPLQSNKVKAIAHSFDWVHSISRLDIAEALHRQRALSSSSLKVCLQINLGGEKTKSGIAPEQAKEFMGRLRSFSNLDCRGLMTILPVDSNEQQQLVLFSQLQQLLQRLNEELDLDLDTLSMGMSNDFIPAIHAGSTMVRIGTALFGERGGLPNYEV